MSSFQKRKPQILYLSPQWPYEAIRSRHVARALKSVGDVTVGVIQSEGERWGDCDFMHPEFPVAFEWEAQLRPLGGIFSRFRRSIDPAFPYPHGLGISEENEKHLRACLMDYDIIWFFKLRTANLFLQSNWVNSVLDIDDLPSGYNFTIVKSKLRLDRRIKARLDAFRWRFRERLLEKRFSVLVSCSEADVKALRAKRPVHVIPNGFERPRSDARRLPAIPARIGFVGLFDYFPNYEGMKWFIESCWPLIKACLPEVRLRMMGRGSDCALTSLGPDIDGLGWVEDPTGEIETWSMMIVPVRVGGGTRVKIAEGFSRKCPIVSTPVGAYGYDVQDGRQLRLASSASEFASACVKLIQDPASAARMADIGWAEFLEKWTWDAIAPRVWAAAEDCLRQKDGNKVPASLG